MKPRIAVKKVDLKNTFIGGSVISKEGMKVMQESTIKSVFARVYILATSLLFIFAVALLIFILTMPIVDPYLSPLSKSLKENIPPPSRRIIAIIGIGIFASWIFYKTYHTFRKMNFPEQFKNKNFDYFIIYDGKEKTLRHELKHIKLGDLDDTPRPRSVRIRSFLWIFLNGL